MHSIHNARSARFVSFAFAVLLLSLSALGCKVHGGGGAIGAPCDFDSDCSALDGGYCTSAGICSRPCVVHEDCGCPAGVTTNDIFNGACDTSCDFSIGACMQVCVSTSECAHAAICGFYDGYPYTTCF